MRYHRTQFYIDVRPGTKIIIFTPGLRVDKANASKNKENVTLLKESQFVTFFAEHNIDKYSLHTDI